MRKWLISLVVVTLGVALLPHVAWAHELITDSTNRAGLLLHVEPDDNPTAGTASNLEFILQNGDVSSATLRVNDVPVPVTVGEAAIAAHYAFPAQGEYTWQLAVTMQDGAQYSFSHSLDVSRGEAPRSGERPINVWAVSGLIGSSILFLLVVGVCWRRRRAIAARSYRH